LAQSTRFLSYIFTFQLEETPDADPRQSAGMANDAPAALQGFGEGCVGGVQLGPRWQITSMPTAQWKAQPPRRYSNGKSQATSSSGLLTVAVLMRSAAVRLISKPGFRDRPRWLDIAAEWQIARFPTQEGLAKLYESGG